MNSLENRLIEAFQKFGFDEYKKIKTTEVVVTQDVFKQCERNTCGNFGKNHACPPRAGDEETRSARIMKYENAFVINKILPIKSRKDMEESMNILIEANKKLRNEFIHDDVVVMASGPCNICEECTALIDKPCRFPDKTQYSMEGCGIDVVRMSMNLKMTYNAGMGKAAFFALVLYKE